MTMTALNYLAIVVICLAVGYVLGYHVRCEMERQNNRAAEVKKKSYDIKV